MRDKTSGGAGPGAPADRVRSYFDAWVADDPATVREALAEGFRFFSPPDPGLDAEAYFERCWPNAQGLRIEIVRLLEAHPVVVVTYDGVRRDGSRFRNTEVFTFEGDRLKQVEVYFGWDL